MSLTQIDRSWASGNPLSFLVIVVVLVNNDLDDILEQLVDTFISLGRCLNKEKVQLFRLINSILGRNIPTFKLEKITNFERIACQPSTNPNH